MDWANVLLFYTVARTQYISFLRYENEEIQHSFTTDALKNAIIPMIESQFKRSVLHD